QWPREAGARSVGVVVAPRRLLLQRLHHDPIELAAEGPAELRRLGPPAGRDRRHLRARLAPPRARARRARPQRSPAAWGRAAPPRGSAAAARPAPTGPASPAPGACCR